VKGFEYLDTYLFHVVAELENIHSSFILCLKRNATLIEEELDDLMTKSLDVITSFVSLLEKIAYLLK